MSRSPKNIFEKHPRLSLILFVLIAFIVLDFLAGLIFIGQDINAFRAPHFYYHHTLLPNQKIQTTWDAEHYYTFITNSMGFRDSEKRKVPLTSDNKRILLIGDSHTEGVGVEFEDSFAGIMRDSLKQQNVELLNAAAVSYSPRLYYLKVKYLIEEGGMDFDKLIVCIDISDIQNELAYENFEPGHPTFIKQFAFKLNKFFNNNSFVYHSIRKLLKQREIDDFYKKAERTDENPKTDLYSGFFDEYHDSELLRNREFHNIGLWYLDREVFEKWGRQGLIKEKWHMAKLAELCREKFIGLTIVVYPWPVQIVAGDLESIQVQFWQRFSKEYKTGFVNLFPAFFEGAPEVNVVEKYYIPGDVHFNEKGHELVARKLLENL
ncbi:MAG: hypothetical protein K9H15_12725 [Bacteroidales bacterium]|nr:hypothetical protein [Bacteroidales bacterium]